MGLPDVPRALRPGHPTPGRLPCCDAPHHARQKPSRGCRDPRTSAALCKPRTCCTAAAFSARVAHVPFEPLLFGFGTLGSTKGICSESTEKLAFREKSVTPNTTANGQWSSNNPPLLTNLGNDCNAEIKACSQIIQRQ